jgi:glucose-1-phosphate thymidylyltransferase
MESLKGLILSGGAGTRLRPITHTSAKQLVPVANKPVLFYGIEALVASGIDEIVIVIAPETGAEIREAAGDGAEFGASITYVEQEAPLGLAHAVLTAEEALGGSPFAMYLGDNLLRDGITGLVESFRHDEHDALLLLTRVQDPWHYGVAELDGERIVRLVEKPEDPPSDLALVGVYLFGPKIFEAARAIEPSGRGELEITDAIQHLIDNGSHVESRTVSGWWKDTGQLADMLEANRLVLEDLSGGIEGELVESRVEGRVAVGPGARIERSQVRGPAIIGAGARIVDAYIGPYTSIGERVTVERSEVEHSILLADCVVSDLDSRMEGSLLGRSVKLTRSEGLPRTLRMIVGDRSEITLP